jgi:methylenetetrahydrofolate dehydrogenase (NADP+)/methenyltetrahydrofolate cyclohydrolase
MKGATIRRPADLSQADLLALVDALNDDPAVHGILVQSPLPPHIDPQVVIRRIRPDKDVDGFHPVNVGKVLIGDADGFAPCTPAGVMHMLAESGVRLAGAEVVVVGRSTIVGKPMAALLVQPGVDATVTVCHSKTRDLKAHVRRADVLVAAIGRAEMIPGEWIKPGSTVVDVGMNRVADPSTRSGYRLCGDVHFHSAREVAARITPVPGGVGPMTIAMLLRNTVRAAAATVGAGPGAA